MSRNLVRKRKSPVRHKVRAHIRSGTPVKSFARGKGEPIPTPSRRRRVGVTKVEPRIVTLPDELLLAHVGETVSLASLGIRTPGTITIPSDWKPGDPTPYINPPDIDVVPLRIPWGPGPWGPPKRPPEFPPTSLLPPSEPSPPTGPIPTPMPILVPDPIPVPPGVIRRRHGGWVQYDVKTGGVTTYIPGTRGQPGIVTYTPDPSKRVPFDPDAKWEPIPIPTPVPRPKGRRRPGRLAPKQIVTRSNQLLAMYKRTKSIPERIDAFNQLKALSDEHMRLTGRPTAMHNIQPTDLFTKKQLEEYGLRIRRKKE